MLDQLNLVYDLKEQFGFDNFQIIELLNGGHYKDIVRFGESLFKLYNEFCLKNSSWGEYVPIDKLDDFLDTLNGSFAFKLSEEADDLSNGVRDYFLYYDEQLYFCSTGKLIEDMNTDEDFRTYLDYIGYFDETKMELKKVLEKHFNKVEV